MTGVKCMRKSAIYDSILWSAQEHCAEVLSMVQKETRKPRKKLLVIVSLCEARDS